MKAVQVNSFGDPVKVVELVEKELSSLGEFNVLVDMEAAPINPSDIYNIQGFYPIKAKLPAIFGSEGIGKVKELGEKVTHLKEGDRVMLPLGSGTWREQLVLPSKKLFALPEADPLQLAMIGVNPPTAYVMLSEFVELKEGDWIIQNAANSAVGRYVICFAKLMGFKTVNIIRRDSLVKELKMEGADVVLMEGPDLIKRINSETGNASIKLGFDAISGKATDIIAQSLYKQGTIITYGALSQENIQLNMGSFMAKDLTLRSFWLVHWLNQRNPETIQTTYSHIINLITKGDLKAKIDSTYNIENIKEALAHATKEGRNGKILVTGPAFKS
ncbi:MAG: zinc-dependent alcohol dehydrogenase family protein [Candidatus Hodarchaeales archaeon]|jgi:NADPH:quinone reductase-like Zn-dependent oxidoreductase